MKITKTKAGTYTVTGITRNQLNAMSTVLNTANDRCFKEPESDGDYYSNDDFVCTLDGKEREALRQVCEAI